MLAGSILAMQQLRPAHSSSSSSDSTGGGRNSSGLFSGVGFVPTVHCLQQWLERAWAKGYDLEVGSYEYQ